MSITVDKSTDGTDTVQLSVPVRYFNREMFKEELLCFLPLKTNTAGETKYTAVIRFFQKNSLELRNWQRDIYVNTLHCNIHQTMLCASVHSHQNFESYSLNLKPTALAFQIVQEQEAQYLDLLQYNDVWWLSRGRVLQWFYAVRKEVAKPLSIYNQIRNLT